MRLLLTNDDGVMSPGLHSLAVTLHDQGHEVLVVAPSAEYSGASASIGYIASGVEFDIDAHRIPDADGIPTFGVAGPPALCVMMVMMEVFGPRPDMVVAGVNLGANCGRVVLSSGTVGAGLLAQSFGLSAMAISQSDSGSPMRWETAGEVAAATVEWLVEAPRKTLLNVNVPNLELGALSGVRWARLAAFGATSTRIHGPVPGRVRVHVSPNDRTLSPDTDTHLLGEGFVTVTGLQGIRAESDGSTGAPPAIAERLGLSVEPS